MRHGVAPSIDCTSVGSLTTNIPVNDSNIGVVPFNGKTRHMLRGHRINYSVHNLDFAGRGHTRVMETTRRNVIFDFYCNVRVVRRVNVSVGGIRTKGTGVFLDPLFHSALTNIDNTAVRLCRASNDTNTTGKTNVNTNVCGSRSRTFTSLGGLTMVRPSRTGHDTCLRTCTS